MRPLFAWPWQSSHALADKPVCADGGGGDNCRPRKYPRERFGIVPGLPSLLGLFQKAPLPPLLRLSIVLPSCFYGVDEACVAIRSFLVVWSLFFMGVGCGRDWMWGA